MPASSCFWAIRACSASYSSSAVGSLWSLAGLGGAAEPSPASTGLAALRHSAALPKEKARRSRDDLPLRLPPFWLMADSCLTAGLSMATGLDGEAAGAFAAAVAVVFSFVVLLV